MKAFWASATTDPTAARGAVASGVREAGVAEAQVGGSCVMNRVVGDVARDGWVCVACGVDVLWAPGFAFAQAAEDEGDGRGSAFGAALGNDVRTATHRACRGRVGGVLRKGSLFREGRVCTIRANPAILVKGVT